MRTPEGEVKDKLKKFLHERKVQSLTHPIEGAVGFYWMPVPSGYGSSFVDFVICYKGQLFAFETKAPGKYPTKRQEAIARMVWEGHGIYEWADNAEEAVNILTSWFDDFDEHPAP